MSTTTSTQGGGARVKVQQFGTFLSNMVMPNIGAFIAWGLITALFIEVGWLPELGIGDTAGSWVAEIGGWGDYAGGGIVGPMITYLLPILIGYTGGKMLYDTRGGVVGAIATMGVIAGTEIPMFMGAMIMGPLGGWTMKKVDSLWDGKIRPGFEMLVNNFSAGIWGGILATFGFFVMSPIVTWISDRLGSGVEALVDNGLLPLTSILIEPAKILFLNNAINHGVLTPLGTAEALEDGKSVLFLLEANPGPGLGLLLAFTVFGRGLAKASAPGAAIIQFLGGIHEIYFPYVLMKPKLIIAMIAGGMTGVFINVLFDVGLRAPAAPGSIFAVYAQTASGSYIGVTLAVLGSAAVTFVVASLLLKTDNAEEAEDQLVGATAQMEAMKGKKLDRQQRARWRHRSRDRDDRPDRVRLRRRHGFLGHGRLGAPQEGPVGGLPRRLRRQQGDLQPRGRRRRRGDPPGPDGPCSAEDAVGGPRVGRQLHEQPEV